jgi:hypothetical protein
MKHLMMLVVVQDMKRLILLTLALTLCASIFADANAQGLNDYDEHYCRREDYRKKDEFSDYSRCLFPKRPEDVEFERMIKRERPKWEKERQQARAKSCRETGWPAEGPPGISDPRYLSGVRNSYADPCSCKEKYPDYTETAAADAKRLWCETKQDVDTAWDDYSHRRFLAMCRESSTWRMLNSDCPRETWGKR